MLRLNVVVNTAQGLRTLNILFQNLTDVRPVLSEWGKWMREDAKRRFGEQPGWAPLAPSTVERLSQTRVSRLTKRGKIRTSYLRNASGMLKRDAKKGVAGKQQQLTELRQLARSARLGTGFQPQSVPMIRLAKAMERAKAGKSSGTKRKIDKHQLLGKLRTSIFAKMTNTSITIDSRVKWADVHNSGGQAGKGAHIPARTFLEVDERSAEQLAQIALAKLLGES